MFTNSIKYRNWYVVSVNGKKSTSINIDEQVWKKAKIEAVKRGISVTQLVERAIKKEIEEH
jgi:predicted HicB family RNase H-like nuclease